MDLKLRSKVCLVTGGSSGIGRATAVLLAAAGARIVATARSVAALEALSGEVRAMGGAKPILLAADLSLEGAPDELAAKALSQAGPVDILVNNAGGSRPMSKPDDAEVWNEAFQLNFYASRWLGELLVPPMAERGWGRVVNITGAIVGKAMNAAASAKAALESWYKAESGLYAGKA